MDDRLTIEATVQLPQPPRMTAQIVTPYVVLGDADIDDLRRQVTSLSASLATATAQVATLQGRVETLSAELTTSEADKTAIEQQLNDALTQLATATELAGSLQRQLSEAEESLATAQAERDKAQQRADGLSADLTAATQQVSDLTGQVAAKQSRIEELEQQKDALTSDLSTAQGKVTDLTGQVATLTDDLATAQSEAAAAEKKLTAAQDDNRQLTADLTAARQQVTTLTQQVADKQAEIVTLTATVAAKQAQIDRLTADLAAATADKEELQRQLTAAQEQATSLQGQLTAANQRIGELTTELTAAQHLQAKTVTITENGQQTIQADEGFAGLSAVGITVDVPTSGGSGDSGSSGGSAIEYPSANPAAYMKKLLADFTPQYAHQLVLLFPEWSGDYSGQYRISYTAGTLRYVFSDGYEVSGSGDTQFSHAWDASKDIQFSATEKVRWVIIDTNIAIHGLLMTINMDGDLSKRIIGLLSNGIDFSNNSTIRDLYSLRWLVFMNGARITASQPYNGYLLYGWGLEYVENLDMTAATDTFNFTLPGNPRMVGITGINRSLTILSAAQRLLPPDTVNAFLDGLSATGSGKTLTIGAPSIAVADAAKLAAAQANGWTIA